MKRPLLFLFILTALGILLLYPHSYTPDPVFPQGQSYSVTVTGKIKTYQQRSDSQLLTLVHCLIQHNGQSYQCDQLLVTTDDLVFPSWQAGNQVQVQGDLSSFQPSRNPGNFDWYRYYRSRHISYRIYADELIIVDSQCDSFRQRLLTWKKMLILRLNQLCGDDTKTASLLTALVLGDDTLLEEDTQTTYKNAGILHILAVSGLHISLLGTAALTLSKKLYLPPRFRSLFCALVVLLYCQLCGNGVSSTRACIMFFCITAGSLLGRTYDSLSALSLAGVLILWTSPTMLFQSGFQLSFGAVLGIHLVCPAFLPTENNSDRCSSSSRFHSQMVSLLHKFLSSLSFGLGLQLTLLPITLYHFFRYPLYSLMLNFVILPLTGPLFLLGGTSLVLDHILPIGGSFLASWCLLPCQWILRLYDILCQLTLSLPQASALLGRPSILRLVLYYSLLAILCLWRYRHRTKLRTEVSPMPLLIPIALAVLLSPLPARSVQVTFLDVGQGDCAFIKTPTGTTLLIDGGSSDIKNMADYRLIPFLESQGVDHLDYVFLSHTDQDHFNGIVDWLESGGTIGTAILPALAPPLATSPSYEQAVLLLKSYQIPIHYFSQGMSWQEGPLLLTCLAPVAPSHPQASLYSDLNTASLVLLLQYQDIRILFTGDCEEEGEQLLLSHLQKQDMTCHILKAGHHGSAYATGQALLNQLHPQIVIVSCGVRNRYGHPHPSLLNRVEQAGISCHVTASCGAITVTLHKGKSTVKTHLPPGLLYYR